MQVLRIAGWLALTGGSQSCHRSGVERNRWTPTGRGLAGDRESTTIRFQATDGNDVAAVFGLCVVRR